jgi:hypothetical protein
MLHAMKKSLRVVTYVRDMLIQTNKFAEFDSMIRQAMGNVDAVLVTSPEALGDNYEVLVTNLNELAAADLMIVFVPPSHRVTPRQPLN